MRDHDRDLGCLHRFSNGQTGERELGFDACGRECLFDRGAVFLPAETNDSVELIKVQIDDLHCESRTVDRPCRFFLERDFIRTGKQKKLAR